MPIGKYRTGCIDELTVLFNLNPEHGGCVSPDARTTTVNGNNDNARSPFPISKEKKFTLLPTPFLSKSVNSYGSAKWDVHDSRKHSVIHELQHEI